MFCLFLLSVLTVYSQSDFLEPPGNSPDALQHTVSDVNAASDLRGERQGQLEFCCSGEDSRCLAITRQDTCEHFKKCEWGVCDDQPTQEPVDPTCSCAGLTTGFDRRCSEHAERHCQEMIQWCRWTCEDTLLCSCEADEQRFANKCSGILSDRICDGREECHWNCDGEQECSVADFDGMYTTFGGPFTIEGDCSGSEEESRCGSSFAYDPVTLFGIEQTGLEFRGWTTSILYPQSSPFLWVMDEDCSCFDGCFSSESFGSCEELSGPELLHTWKCIDPDYYSTCEYYCTLAAFYCTGDHAIFSDIPTCLSSCAEYPVGTDADISGNTLGCRINQLEIVTTGQPMYCHNAAVDGGAVCVECSVADFDGMYTTLGGPLTIEGDCSGSEQESRCGNSLANDLATLFDMEQTGLEFSGWMTSIWYPQGSSFLWVMDEDCSCFDGCFSPESIGSCEELSGPELLYTWNCVDPDYYFLTCDYYCTLSAFYCTGDHAIFSDVPTCLTSCAEYPVGTDADISGNTLGCRINQFEIVTTGQPTYCHNAAVDGGAVCVDVSVTYLHQTDFDSGTYRITDAGVYILAEDINFSPNPSNDYMPIYPDQEAEYPREPNGPYHLGFFAAVTVETCNVVLDLGGYELRSSDAFTFQQRFYAHIELANQPFIPGQGPSDFGPTLMSACDTVVRNGKLGLSSHHAIHANGASNIILEHLECFDFEVGGIHLNGPNNVTMNDIDIGPSRHDLKQTHFYSHGRFTVPFLEAIEASDPTAQLTFSGRSSPSTIVDIRTALQHQMDLMFRYFINDDVSATQDPDWNEALTLFNSNDGNSILPDGAALYGIVLNKNGVAVNGFGFGETTDVFSNVQITNCHIHDLDLVVMELVVPAYDDQVMLGPVGDAISFPFMSSDYTNMTNNYYKGNVVADAQMAVAILGELLGLDIGSTFVSDEVKTWATDQIDYASAIAPAAENHHLVCAGDDMHHSIKGIIGLRIEFVDDVVISDVDITDLHNFGPLGSTICGEYDSPDDPGANVFGTENEGFMGADVRAISTQEVQTIAMSEVIIQNIFTESGDAIGVDVRERSTDVDMFDVDICEVMSFLDVPDGTDLPLPNSDPSSCGVTVDATSTVSIDPTVTAGQLAAEDVCPSEAANIIEDC